MKDTFSDEIQKKGFLRQIWQLFSSFRSDLDQTNRRITEVEKQMDSLIFFNVEKAILSLTLQTAFFIKPTKAILSAFN